MSSFEKESSRCAGSSDKTFACCTIVNNDASQVFAMVCGYGHLETPPSGILRLQTALSDGCAALLVGLSAVASSSLSRGSGIPHTWNSNDESFAIGSRPCAAVVRACSGSAGVRSIR